MNVEQQAEIVEQAEQLRVVAVDGLPDWEQTSVVQLEVGELTTTLMGIEDKSLPVRFDFCGFSPTALTTYADDKGDRSFTIQSADHRPPTVTEVLTMLATEPEDAGLWVESRNVVVGVVEADGYVVLETEWV